MDKIRMLKFGKFSEISSNTEKMVESLSLFLSQCNREVLKINKYK